MKKKNENPIKNRQYSRVMKMEDYISSPNACPEETIFQIGKCSDEGKADAAALTNIFQEYVEWHNKKYPQAVFLDAALPDFLCKTPFKKDHVCALLQFYKNNLIPHKGDDKIIMSYFIYRRRRIL